jgi:hypothetical protein
MVIMKTNYPEDEHPVAMHAYARFHVDSIILSPGRKMDHHIYDAHRKDTCISSYQIFMCLQSGGIKM